MHNGKEANMYFASPLANFDFEQQTISTQIPDQHAKYMRGMLPTGKRRRVVYN